MKKQLIKQLADSIVKDGEVSEYVSGWLLTNLSGGDIKSLAGYLSAAMKENTVIVKYAGQPSDLVKNKIDVMFPNKKIVYVRNDNEIGVGIKFEFGDFILDYTVTNMIVKIMKDLKESL